MVVSINKARNCVTHHHACDCREFRHQKWEAALDQILELSEGSDQYTDSEPLAQIWLISYNALEGGINEP